MKEFLKKILGKGQEESAKSFLGRSPRVKIPMMDRALFVDSSGKVFPLRNLSETGLALVDEEGTFPDEASGEIHVGGEKVAVKLRTMRRSPKEVGAHFLADASALRGLLRRAFGDEIQAQSMTEVDSQHQKEVREGKPRWYYAPGNHELFFVEHEGKVIRFELEWNGKLLVYAEGALRMGKIDRKGDDREKQTHARSALVQWADQVRPEDLAKARRLLENIKGLEKTPRDQMQGLLA